MVNLGAHPIIASSPTGQLRHKIGDTASTPLDPPQPGLADYAVFSDVALEIALVTAGGSILRAAGGLCRTLAVEYAQSGKSIKTDDLALDTRDRGKTLLDVAQSFFDEADAAEGAAAVDFFAVAPFAGRTPSAIHVEGSPWPTPWSLPNGLPSGGFGSGGYGEGGGSLDGGAP